MGRTKQAESWPQGVPAFMSVGELGRNSSSVMIRAKWLVFSVPTAFATLWNRSSGVSPGMRYLLARSTSAGSHSFIKETDVWTLFKIM